jgi:tryptophan synthase alpha chain
MSRLSQVFEPGHTALIAYITIGYPDIETTMKVAPELEKAGCDIIELGIPFSDPVADGPTIQRASFAALEGGVSMRLCLKVARELRQRISAPLLFLSYYNPVLQFGLGDFCRSCAEAGIDGLIIPDLPPEEGAEPEALASDCNLDLVYLLAPTSTEERIKLVAERARGFIYLVSLTGVTGARDTLPSELEGFVRRVRGRTEKPLYVGFGISSPEQAWRVAQVADGVIVGSRLIELLGQDNPIQKACSFITSLRQALNSKNKEV